MNYFFPERPVWKYQEFWQVLTVKLTQESSKRRLKLVQVLISHLDM